MCSEWENVKPDIVTTGKALSGGMMPISAAFCNDNIMMNIHPGEHGSTFGGNPLAMAVAKASIEVIIEEKMVENSLKMGEIMGNELLKMKAKVLADVRGRGLFWCIEMKKDTKFDANDLAYDLMGRHILTKAT
jgi:ornithine--oxo-acid transaminase